MVAISSSAAAKGAGKSEPCGGRCGVPEPREAVRLGYLSWSGFSAGYFVTIGFKISEIISPIDFPIMRRYSLNSSAVHNVWIFIRAASCSARCLMTTSIMILAASCDILSVSVHGCRRERRPAPGRKYLPRSPAWAAPPATRNDLKQAEGPRRL
jgi:hypothetical protein